MELWNRISVLKQSYYSLDFDTAVWLSDSQSEPSDFLFELTVSKVVETVSPLAKLLLYTVIGY